MKLRHPSKSSTRNGLKGLISRVGLLCLAGAMSLSLRTHADEAKPVLVHYMPWYVAKPYSGSWGWHWTMNHFNPDTTNGLGQREIASWYYPEIGPYDSADPVVLEYHVLLMKLAGIDGVVVDWYGQDNYNDYGIINTRTLALLDYTRRAGLKFSLCFEDRTVQEKINGGFINASGAISNAQQTMLYAQANYFSSSNYLRWSNQPVLLNFGPQYFKTNAQWQSIFSVLTASNQPAFFTEDIRLPVGQGAFNWPPMWLSQSSGGVLTPTALNNYLNNFEQNGSGWPGYISSAFPRFHDIYQQAGLGFTYGLLDDNNGATFQSTLTRALTNQSVMIQLVTWNDFGEGTVIEPTAEFGCRDLALIQDLRRQYIDAAFPHNTNDLGLPLRLYQLRRQFAGNKVVNAELDRAFAKIVAGDLEAARLQLAGMESRAPVIYGLSITNNSVQFSIGGYLSTNGADIQSTSNLSSAWQTVVPLSVDTNAPNYSAPIAPEGAPAYFRVRTFDP